jgi:predicted hydrocarbon binding protein/CheY-like chemotaxis protein
MSHDLVYVVHSESAVAAALSESLHDSGFEVVSMTTVTEAQDLINGRQFALPDAILTPLGGVEVGDSILFTLFESNPLMEQIPLVVVASTEKDERRRALRMGLLSVVFPPYDGEEVALTTKLAIEKHRSDQLLFGSLSQLSVPDLLQTAEVGRRSGTITIQHNGDKGTVWLRDGLVIDAEVADRCRGEEAVYAVALWTTGTFEANFGTVDVSPRFEIPPSELLLEAMRRVDEECAGKSPREPQGDARVAALDLSLALLNVVVSYSLNHLEPALVGERFEDLRASLSKDHPPLEIFLVNAEGPVTVVDFAGVDFEVEELANAVAAWVLAFFEKTDLSLAWRFTGQRLARLVEPWRSDMQELGFLGPLGILELSEDAAQKEIQGPAHSAGEPVPVGCLTLDGDDFVEVFSGYGMRVGHIDPKTVIGKPLEAVIPAELLGLVQRLQGELTEHNDVSEQWTVGEGIFRAGHQECMVRIALVRTASKHGLIMTVNRMRDRRRSLSPEIERDPLTGSLSDGGADRLLVANDDFLQAFEGLFARSLSHRHHELLQRFGKKWGLRHAMRLEQLVQRDYRMTLREMESQMALELLSSSVGVLGLGRFEADLGYRDNGLVIIKHQASPFPGTFVATAGGACSILSGFHAAVLSYLAGRNLAAREVRCSRKLGDPCLFVVATEERLTKLLIATPGSADHDLLEGILRRSNGGEEP